MAQKKNQVTLSFLQLLVLIYLIRTRSRRHRMERPAVADGTSRSAG